MDHPTAGKTADDPRRIMEEIRHLLLLDPAAADERLAHLAALAATGPAEIRRTAELARAYVAHAHGRYAEALADCERVITTPGDALQTAEAENLAGTVYFERGDYPAATSRYLRAQEGFEALGARGPYGNTLNNLALVHWRLDDRERARALFQRALTIYESLEEPRAIGTALYNLGLVAAPDDTQAALDYYDRAYPWLERARDVQGMANALANAADAFEARGELDRATERAERALALREQVRHRRGVAGSRIALARLALARNDPERAQRELDLALPLVRDMQLNKQEVDGLRLQARVHAAAGRYREAWECEARAAERRELLVGQDAAHRIAELEARFELEHARREAERRAREADELRAAREAALAASRAKSEFVAVMGHEIRTPLTVLIGNTELLGRTDLSPRQLRLHHKLGESARSLHALVSDILDFSRIEAGHVECTQVVYSPSELLRRVEEAAAGRVRSHAVQVKARLGGSVPPRVLGDRDHTQQVLINLANNALKFTPAGEIEVRVACPQPGSLVYTVRDTGIGIDPDELERLFEPFTQADGSNERTYGGAGLGLAIARSLARAMGGTLVATSRLGEGSTFTLTVPVATPPRDELLAATTLPPPDDADEVVLVVDDNPDVRSVIALLLEALGATALEAPSGPAALELLEQFHPDLVLLDVQMPGMDGYAVVRELRRASGGQLYVVGLTGAATADARAAGLEAGMDDYVAKPIDLNGLRRILGRARAARPRATPPPPE